MRTWIIFFALTMAAAAQDYTVETLSRHILTNESIVTLAKAGFDELFIIERIRSSRTRFDVSVDGLVALRKAGLSEDLIRVMALNDLRTYPTPISTEPAGSIEVGKARVESHWWGFKWVRKSRE